MSDTPERPIPEWAGLAPPDAPTLSTAPAGSAAPDPATATQMPETPAWRAAPAREMPARISRFEVRAYVGEGAFGTVYRAFDPTLHREVALKVAKSERMQSPARVARFEREARAAASLQHPHIVAVF